MGSRWEMVGAAGPDLAALWGHFGVYGAIDQQIW
jgi:hypothetical protein